MKNSKQINQLLSKEFDKLNRELTNKKDYYEIVKSIGNSLNELQKKTVNIDVIVDIELILLDPFYLNKNNFIDYLRTISNAPFSGIVFKHQLFELVTKKLTESYLELIEVEKIRVNELNAKIQEKLNETAK